SSYKGVQKEVLAEGRWFLNPILYSYERVKMTDVPKGKCLVLTRLAGTPIDPERQAKGEFLAKGDFEDLSGERGELEKYRTQGRYRINPYLYKADVVDAYEIKANQVGVRTLKWGKDPRELIDLVSEGKKILKDPKFSTEKEKREALKQWVEAKIKEAKWKP